MILRRSFIATTTLCLAGCLGDTFDEVEYVDPPDVTFDIVGNNRDGIRITVTDGSCDTQFVSLQGDATYGATPDTLNDVGPPQMTAGDFVELHYTLIQAGELRLVWIGSEEHELLATFDVPR